VEQTLHVHPEVFPDVSPLRHDGGHLNHSKGQTNLLSLISSKYVLSESLKNP
jgi:hypothetical protein